MRPKDQDTVVPKPTRDTEQEDRKAEGGNKEFHPPNPVSLARSQHEAGPRTRCEQDVGVHDNGLSVTVNDLNEHACMPYRPDDEEMAFALSLDEGKQWPSDLGTSPGKKDGIEREPQSPRAFAKVLEGMTPIHRIREHLEDPVQIDGVATQPEDLVERGCTAISTYGSRRFWSDAGIRRREAQQHRE